MSTSTLESVPSLPQTGNSQDTPTLKYSEALNEALREEMQRDPKEVAQKVQYLITMLPNSPEVQEVLTGPNGVIEVAAPGTVVVDRSSISPIAARAMSEILTRKGLKFLDAPVSGGELGAINATLSIMVGGPEEVFNECKDILLVMGKSVVRVGHGGSGNVTSLVEKKKAALLAHVSQDSEGIWSKHREIIASFRGREAGVVAAEAFFHLTRDSQFSSLPGA